jgi:hypothetical protein
MSANTVTAPSLFSDMWFSRLSDVLSRVDPDEGWSRLDLGIAIDDAPKGPIRYTLHVGPEGASLEIGTVESAAVTLVESFDTATAIEQGASVSELLAEGRISVRGDASALVAAQRPLTMISAILGELAEDSQS